MIKQLRLSFKRVNENQVYTQ